MYLLIYIGLFSTLTYDKYADKIGLFCMSFFIDTMLFCMSLLMHTGLFCMSLLIHISLLYMSFLIYISLFSTLRHDRHSSKERRSLLIYIGLLCKSLGHVHRSLFKYQARQTFLDQNVGPFCMSLLIYAGLF